MCAHTFYSSLALADLSPDNILIDRYPSQILTKSQNLHCNSDSYFKAVEHFISYLFSLAISILLLFTFQLFQKKQSWYRYTFHIISIVQDSISKLKCNTRSNLEAEVKKTTDVKIRLGLLHLFYLFSHNFICNI